MISQCEQIKYIIYESSIKDFKTMYRYIVRQYKKDRRSYVHPDVQKRLYNMHREVLFLVSGRYQFDEETGMKMIKHLKEWCYKYDEMHNVCLYERLVDDHVFEFKKHRRLYGGAAQEND